MNCNKVDHLIMKYMDGILTMEEAKHLNQHITKCDTCREEFFTYQKMIDVLQDGQLVEAPKDFEATVMNRIKDIEIDYEVKEKISIDTISAMVWGLFSLIFGIGVLLVLYRYPIIEYLVENPYLGDWASSMVPTVDILSTYISDIKEEIISILSTSKYVFSSLRLILIPVLSILGAIKYYIYRKAKVEI
ncbi:MAG: hypothetical protein GX327_04345 [Epulopiscium sp.]|jgi:hypothetical protein|nr:hypothetical protein [Candidatus Epulonipiscium sp.]